MNGFLNDDFLLTNATAKKLYHQHAATQPIFDYHCHLDAADIASNRRFANLYDIWLAGDHYKWRAMRANGIPEKYITGDATPYEKFLAWARTVPHTLRNPLFVWTHLELRRYFGISELLDEHSAQAIWGRANAQLAEGFTARAILQKFRVEVVCTTNDPTDDLAAHREIALAKLSTRVYPTFRPDAALKIGQPEFLPWVEKLSSSADIDVRDLKTLVEALEIRHNYFHGLGCRLSDHGLAQCYATPSSEKTADVIFSKARSGQAISRDEREQFASFLMLFFARLDAQRGWTKQLHLGALRNVNSSALSRLGADTGFDAIGDFPQIAALAAYLDLLTRENALPRMIVYNANPSDTFALATLLGSFQDGQEPGKLQYGSAWWFLDQRAGIAQQIAALSNAGLLAHFVGMVTDSRSFMSYPRHEYFRRILCDLVGQDVERGELPDKSTDALPADDGLLAKLVRDICYGNARRYFHLMG